MVLYIIVRGISKLLKWLNMETFYFNLKNGNSNETIYYDVF